MALPVNILAEQDLPGAGINGYGGKLGLCRSRMETSQKCQASQNQDGKQNEKTVRLEAAKEIILNSFSGTQNGC